MNKTLIAAGLLLALLAVVGISLFFGRDSDRNTFVTVTGDAETKVRPDTAEITFSVVTQSSQALTAQQDNAKRSEAVKQAIEATAAGVSIEVKTSNYSLDPERDYSGRMPRIVGYEVKNSITVRVGSLENIGGIIDAATKAGANSVEGIRFVVGEASPSQGDALALATKKAMAKAESIATAVNGRVVRIVETREHGIAVPEPRRDWEYRASANSMADIARNAVTPIQPGDVPVRSDVVLVVEIAPNR
ncbi:MAG TPA: SIMPL domain-containing protein [Pyrinomonadaceae bacterium]|nr:SIMPL domain-containing protein [Pyrinomonadaceae bacterium]